MKRLFYLFFVVLIALSIMVACSSSNESNTPAPQTQNPQNNTPNQSGGNNTPPAAEPEKDPDPVTLVFSWPWPEERFINEIKEPVENALPWVTLEYLQIGGVGKLDEIIAQNDTLPDIFVVDNPVHLIAWSEREILTEMEEFIEKFNFDTSRINPTLLAEMRKFAEGKLYTLPFNQGMMALYYNKDIFDMFGVDYPVDDMNWDQVIELATKVTGNIDGVQYHGLHIPYPQVMLAQRDIPNVIAETDEPAYTNPNFRPLFEEYLERLQRLYSIPGIFPEDVVAQYLVNDGVFRQQRNVAMMGIWSLIGGLSQDEDFNWDLVSYPTWPDRPGISRPSQAANLGISAFSPHQDQAFKVIEYLLTDEYQTFKAGNRGQASVLVNPETNANLFAEMIEERPWLAEKNLQALTRLDFPTDLKIHSKYNSRGMLPLHVWLFEGEMDINTILNTAQETAAERIREAKLAENN